MLRYFMFFMMLICSLQSCKAQKNINQNIMLPEVNKKSEKFDIETFEKEKLGKKRISISNNNYIEEDSFSKGYIRRIYFQNSYFKLNKKFHGNGFIFSKGVLFNNGSQIGIWYEFDNEGGFLKETNMDKGYNFDYKKIISYCEKNKISLPKGYVDSGFQTSVYKEKDDNGAAVWVITHQTAGDKLERITLGGDTGKELEKTDLEFINH